METTKFDLTKENSDKINYQEFFLFKDNNIYKIILEKNASKICISSGNYFKNYNLDELSTLFKINFFSLDNAYNFLVDLFEDYKVSINNKIKYKELKIKFSLPKEENIEIKLIYEGMYQNNSIIESIKKLKDEINNLKNKNSMLQKEINSIKQNKFKQNKAPTNIKLLYTIEEKSYADYGLDNSFAVFNSFNNILYLVYSTRKKSMICYDVKNNSLISEMKNCHQGYITGLRHYADKIKPWFDTKGWFADEWWKYAKTTPYINYFKINFIINILKSILSKFLSIEKKFNNSNQTEHVIIKILGIKISLKLK